MTIVLKSNKRFLSVLVSMICLFGCQSKEETKVSTDVNTFNSLVTIDIPLKSVSWEVFGTPEYTGGVPGPTDYVTLIAQAESPNNTKHAQVRAATPVGIAPESARPWLDPEFRRWLENSKNTTVDISKTGNCRTLTGLLNKTKKSVTGFACEGKTKTLIYLRIANYT